MREIPIDTDTVVGYDYENQYYYVTNKGTTTTRTTVQHTLDVLNIVAPDTVDEERLIRLKEDVELLTDLYYTWEDTGAYIKTIQLNDYSKYPLVLDGEKKKIYIMNSTIIIDLTLNESRVDKIEQLQAFYRDTIGLYINTRDLNVLYSILLSFYNPTCYNTIQETTNPATEEYTLKFTNTLKLSDYRDKAQAEYTCLFNPTNQYNNDNTIAYIQNITDNVITLTSEVPQQIKVGTIFNIANTTTQIDIATYSADGTYTVKEVNNNQIFTTENLPATFNVTLPTLNIQAYQNPIISISRENQTITLTNSATDYIIGDTIVVQGATIQTDYETLSLDGFYTIIEIEDNVLHVDEVPLTDYTSTEGTAYTYKPIPVGTVTAIENTEITLAENPPSTLVIGTPIAVFTTIPTQEFPVIQYATVTGTNNLTIDTDTVLKDNVPRYGLLREPLPYTDTLITIEDSKREEVLPNGTFMVDTPDQAIQYLGLLLNEEYLPLNDKNGTYLGNFTSCGMEVPSTYMITEHLSTGINPEMECLGLYSKIYTE